MLINETNPHGGQIYNKKVKLDFSVNVNPLGTPETVVEQAYKGILEAAKYPDANCSDLREAIAQRDNVSKDFVICGNGGAELIFQAVAALKPKRALIIEPTFCEYRQSLENHQCQIDTYQLSEAKYFDINIEIEEILKQVTPEVEMVFLCNPNNPTGLATSKKAVEKLIHQCHKVGALLFVDESFGELTDGYERFSIIDQVSKYDNLFVLKSMTKTYAIAGIRLGYGLCSNRGLLEKMCRNVQCWNVSMVAQMAGVAALKCKEYTQESTALISKERNYMIDELMKLGIKVFPGKANYLMLHCEKNLYKLLLQKEILVRSCANFKGLKKNYYRIAIKKHSENQKLINAITEIYNEVGRCTKQV